MSYHTSLTGLTAASFQLATTSNNIANVQTHSFKRSRAGFEDIFSSTLRQGGQQVGQGVMATELRQQFNQGSIETSRNVLDLAILGNGFLPVKSPQDPRPIYTRDGAFRLDANNFVVNNQGEFLQVAKTDAKGNAIGNGLIDLQLPPRTEGQFQATTRMEQVMNLPANARTIDVPFDARQPSTYNFQQNAQLIDDTGAEREGKLFYIKTQGFSENDPNSQWKVMLMVDGQLVMPKPRTYQRWDTPSKSVTDNALEWSGRGDAQDRIQIQSASQPDTGDGTISVVNQIVYRGTGTAADKIGTVDAEKNGADGKPLRINLSQTGTTPSEAIDALVSYSRIITDNEGVIRFNPSGDLAPDLQTIEFANPYGNSGKLALKLTGSRQSASAFTVGQPTQDGRPEGGLTDVRIEKNGLVRLSYSNGHEALAGKIVLARFAQADGLDTLGDTRYVATDASGQAQIKTPGTEGLGTLQSGARETSNVDLTSEMLDLIVAQRNFQANAKAVEANSYLTKVMSDNLR